MVFKPKVSIIVPNYNHARFLEQRLESILAQSFQEFELILLDDCSSDESRSILDEYREDPRVRVVFNSINSGSTFKQWNKGVRMARGEYVWIAESDDYADRYLLQELVSRLDAEPNAVFAYCRSRTVSADGRVNGFLESHLADIDPQKWTEDFLVNGPDECEKYLVYRNTVLNASAVVFRREVYERVGGADERLVFCGDWKTWAAMALTGGTIAYLGKPLNYCRCHNSTVRAKSQRFGLEAAEYLEVIHWIAQRVTLPEATREHLSENLFSIWSSAVLYNQVPFKRRLAIVRRAMAVDRLALRRLFRPAVRLILSRCYRALRGKSPWSESSLRETGGKNGQ